MSDELEVFLNKVDAFAQGLDPTEQAMLAHLICDEPDDVTGFTYEAWPIKVRDIAPRRIADMGSILSAGHTTGFLSSGHTTGIVKGGGGSDI